jgi:uncharacterized protein (TIGR02284 family)
MAPAIHPRHGPFGFFIVNPANSPGKIPERPHENARASVHSADPSMAPHLLLRSPYFLADTSLIDSDGPRRNPMEKNDVISELRDLIQLDIDAIRAYEQAIESSDAPTVKNHLQDFKNDHEQHVTNLSAFMTKLGGNPLDRTPDMKGFLIQGFTTIRRVTGAEGALNAMETNERLTNSTYKTAVEKQFPPEIQKRLK